MDSFKKVYIYVIAFVSKNQQLGPLIPKLLLEQTKLFERADCIGERFLDVGERVDAEQLASTFVRRRRLFRLEFVVSMNKKEKIISIGLGFVFKNSSFCFQFFFIKKK